MYFQLPICLSKLRIFLPNLCSKLYIVNKNLVFDKREVYRPTFIIGLSAKLYGRVISKLSSYWVASSYWDAIVTDYLIVKYGL